MPAQFGNPKARAKENLLAQSKVRLFDPSSQQYLHCNGHSTTNSDAWSWLGFKYQAETLQQRAIARGEDWPFITVPRNNPHTYEPDKVQQ